MLVFVIMHVACIGQITSLSAFPHIVISLVAVVSNLYGVVPSI